MKKTSVKILSVLFALLMIAPLVLPAFAAPVLNFRDDGSFTILQLTDTQDDDSPAYALEGFLKKAIQTADPDLIVFTGDIVEDSRMWGDLKDKNGLVEGVNPFGINNKDKEKIRSKTRKAADFVLNILNESGVPFAVALGNNDYNVFMSNEQWLEVFSKYQNNLTVKENDGDGINFRLPVYSNGVEVFDIYAMDTMKHNVSSDAIEWFKATAVQNAVPSFVFQHVPVGEARNLFEKCKPTDKGATLCGDGYYRLKDGGYGYFELLPQGARTSDEFAAWKEAGNVLAAFFGHIHSDAYTGTYDGIELNLTYGCQFAKPSPYGMRVIKLSADDLQNYDNTSYRYVSGGFKAEKKNAISTNIFRKIFIFIKNFVYMLRNR